MANAPTPPAAAHPHPHHTTGPHELRFVSYPKLLFVWPIILLGYLLFFLAGDGNNSNVAWLYIWVVMLVVMALGVDIGRNAAVFWIVLVAAIYFLGLWLHDAKHITIFGDIYNFFRAMDVQYNRHFGLVISILLSVPYAVMMGWAWLNDRWRITHNEFEHWSFGRMDDSLGRGAKTIRTEFPDMFEVILGLCGTLIVFDATGTRELRRIPHVMFLPLVRSKLNKILERTAVTPVATAAEEEETQV